MTAPDLVAKVRNLAPVSHAALRLVNLLGQPAISNSEVVEALKCDNVLTAKLLRACNSPYFGLAESVASAEQAVMILGHQQILHIVLTLAFGSTMAVSKSPYTMETNSLWRHSLVTASAAEIVINQTGALNADASVAFTVGLLHDLGKLVMGQALTAEAQAEIRRRVEQDEISWPGAERLVVGVDHAELGGFLLGKWRLPEEIVEAVANHHQPELEPFPRLSAVACLSNALAHAANPISGQGKVAAGFGPEVLSVLEISPEQFDTMTALVRQSLDRAEQLMTMG